MSVYKISQKERTALIDAITGKISAYRAAQIINCTPHTVYARFFRLMESELRKGRITLSNLKK